MEIYQWLDIVHIWAEAVQFWGCDRSLCPAPVIYDDYVVTVVVAHASINMVNILLINRIADLTGQPKNHHNDWAGRPLLLFRIKSFEFDLEGAAVAEFELFAVVHEIFPCAPPIFLDGGQYGLECAIKANMAA